MTTKTRAFATAAAPRWSPRGDGGGAHIGGDEDAVGADDGGSRAANSFAELFTGWFYNDDPRKEIAADGGDVGDESHVGSDDGEEREQSELVLSTSTPATAEISVLYSSSELGGMSDEADDESWFSTSENEYNDEEKYDWKSAWEAFCEQEESDYRSKFNETLIANLFLPFDIDDFYHLVLQNDAPHSIGGFLESMGDSNVETSPWIQGGDFGKERDADGGEVASKPLALASTETQRKAKRQIRYVHPVSAPMAPPTAGACKSQELRVFGDAGLCLDTITVVEDVPMADCFVVRDRMTLSSDSRPPFSRLTAKAGSDVQKETSETAKERKRGCTLTVQFEIRFVKGTMFRRIIESTTRTEVQKWWNAFGKTMEELANEVAEEEESLSSSSTVLVGEEDMLLIAEEEEGRGSAGEMSLLFDVETNKTNEDEVVSGIGLFRRHLTPNGRKGKDNDDRHQCKRKNQLAVKDICYNEVEKVRKTELEESQTANSERWVIVPYIE